MTYSLAYYHIEELTLLQIFKTKLQYIGASGKSKAVGQYGHICILYISIMNAPSLPPSVIWLKYFFSGRATNSNEGGGRGRGEGKGRPLMLANNRNGFLS